MRFFFASNYTTPFFRLCKGKVNSSGWRRSSPLQPARRVIFCSTKKAAAGEAGHTHSLAFSLPCSQLKGACKKHGNRNQQTIWALSHDTAARHHWKNHKRAKTKHRHLCPSVHVRPLRKLAARMVHNNADWGSTRSTYTVWRDWLFQNSNRGVIWKQTAY